MASDNLDVQSRPAWYSQAWACCLSCCRDVISGLAVDRTLLVLLVIYAALWGPLVARSTTNPQLLAAYTNDDPMITQQLVGMTLRPLGDPANLMRNPGRRPAYWGSIQYGGGLYYGGTYLDLAFLVFEPLHKLGFPDFPAAPIILRCVSLLSTLVALALVYNLGKKIGGRLAAFGAALLLMVDFWINCYASMIHPDTTMMAAGLLALWVAIRHVEKSDLWSLLTFGLLVGVTHGAKAGGPWLMPVGLLAAWWGWRRLTVPGESRWFGLGRLTVRTGLLGCMALAGFFLTTPYAFLNSYYRTVMRDTFQFNMNGPFAGICYGVWFQEIWNYEGAFCVALILAALVLVPLRCLRREKPVALVLTAVLLLSVLAWYTTMVRLWTVVGYLLPGLAIAGILVADLVSRPVVFLAGRGRLLRWSGIALGAGCVCAVLYFRGIPLLNAVAVQYTRDRWNVVEIGRWATEHLPHNSKIIYDDIAYFDPQVFPNAMFHGGLLTYKDLETKKPDYFILSGTIYNASYYKKLRETQHYTHGHEGEFSVLLYQDCLDRGGIPEAELVGKLTDHTPPQPHPICFMVSYLRLALGLEDYTMGTDFWVFRYRPYPHAEQPVSVENGNPGS